MTYPAANPWRRVAHALAAIDIAGIVGIIWLMVPVWFYDGFMVIEFSIWATAFALLTAVTIGGLVCLFRGPLWAAMLLLAIGAIPTAFVIGGTLYLQVNPIDWK